MSKKITYTTDVAHCMGRDCPIRNKCVRFYNHQRAHVFSNECVPYTEEQYDFETKQCEMLKPIEI